jgi:hypothetical protein
MIMIARNFSLLRQLVWAATLATGFAVLWSLLALWLGLSLHEEWQGPRRNWPPREEFVVKTDGTPLVRSSPADNYSLATYRDLNGGEHNGISSADQLAAVYISGAEGKPGFFTSRIGWAERLKRFENEQEPKVNWFFVHNGEQQGAGYFVGYERETNRRVGFIGISGFHSDPVPSEDWIPVRGTLMNYTAWSSAWVYVSSGRQLMTRPGRFDLPPRLVYVPSGNQLRMVDLAARTVTTVFESLEPIESVGIPGLAAHTNGRVSADQRILVRTRDQIHVLDRWHEIIKVFAIPAEVERQSAGEWYELGDGQSIIAFIRPTTETENVTRQIAYRIAGDGTIRDRFELTLQTGTRVMSKQAGALLAAVALPAPAIVSIVDSLIANGNDQLPSSSEGVMALLKDSGPTLLAVFALATILAVMALRRSRAFGQSRREQISWAVFVFLFGVPAYVGFLLHRRWPTRGPCPNCEAQAPRDRLACAECGSPFPAPALKGIEIFA